MIPANEEIEQVPYQDSDEYRLRRVYQLRSVIERRLEEHLASGEDVDEWDGEGETFDEHVRDCRLCGRLTGLLDGIDAALTILLEHDWGNVQHTTEGGEE